jgi:hypothetical protein
MKKSLFLLFCPLFCLAQVFISTSCAAQKTHVYANLDLDLVSYQNSFPALGVSFSLGAKWKMIGLGAGATLSTWNSDPYLPVYLELSAYSNKRMPRPQFVLRTGYGLRMDTGKVGGIDEKGGLYVSPGVGYMVPVNKSDFVMKLSYVFSQFSVKRDTGETLSTSNVSGWAISAGFTF